MARNPTVRLGLDTKDFAAGLRSATRAATSFTTQFEKRVTIANKALKDNTASLKEFTSALKQGFKQVTQSTEKATDSIKNFTKEVKKSTAASVKGLTAFDKSLEKVTANMDRMSRTMTLSFNRVSRSLNKVTAQAAVINTAMGSVGKSTNQSTLSFSGMGRAVTDVARSFRGWNSLVFGTFRTLGFGVTAAVSGFWKIGGVVKNVIVGSFRKFWDISKFAFSSIHSGITTAISWFMRLQSIVGISLVGAFTLAINKAVEYETSLRAIELLSKRVGANVFGITSMVKSQKGGMFSELETFEGIKTALALGAKQSEINKLMGPLRDAAALFGEDLSTAFTAVMRAAVHGEPELAERFGLQLREFAVLKESKALYGKRLSDLDEEQKRIVVMTAALKQLSRFRGAENMVMNTSLGLWNKFKSAISDFTVSFGRGIKEVFNDFKGFRWIIDMLADMSSSKSPLTATARLVKEETSRITNQLNAVLEPMKKFIQGEAGSTAETLGKKVGRVLSNLFSTIVNFGKSVYNWVTSNWGTITSFFYGIADAVIGVGKAIAYFLSNNWKTLGSIVFSTVTFILNTWSSLIVGINNMMTKQREGGIFDWIGAVGREIGTHLAGNLNQIGISVSSVGDAFKYVFVDLFEKARVNILYFIDLLTGVFSPQEGENKSFFERFIDGYNRFKEELTAGYNVIKEIASSLMELYKGMTEPFKESGSGFISQLTAFMESVKNTFSWMFKNLGTWLTLLLASTVLSPLFTILTAIKAAFNLLWVSAKGVKNLLSKLGGKGTDTSTTGGSTPQAGGIPLPKKGGASSKTPPTGGASAGKGFFGRAWESVKGVAGKIPGAGLLGRIPFGGALLRGGKFLLRNSPAVLGAMTVGTFANSLYRGESPVGAAIDTADSMIPFFYTLGLKDKLRAYQDSRAVNQMKGNTFDEKNVNYAKYLEAVAAAQNRKRWDGVDTGVVDINKYTEPEKREEEKTISDYMKNGLNSIVEFFIGGPASASPEVAGIPQEFGGTLQIGRNFSGSDFDLGGYASRRRSGNDLDKFFEQNQMAANLMKYSLLMTKDNASEVADKIFSSVGGETADFRGRLRQDRHNKALLAKNSYRNMMLARWMAGESRRQAEIKRRNRLYSYLNPAIDYRTGDYMQPRHLDPLELMQTIRQPAYAPTRSEEQAYYRFRGDMNQYGRSMNDVVVVQNFAMANVQPTTTTAIANSRNVDRSGDIPR